MKFLLCLFFLVNCNFFSDKSETDSQKKILLALGILASIPDAYAKLYYLNPLFLENPNNFDYLQLPSVNKGNNSKKLIFIHGWNLSDPEQPTYPNEIDIKTRIKSQWDHLIIEDPNFLKSILLKNYDLYFFTYLTSNNIETNGVRFRAHLDSTFTGQTSTVNIFGHSMGGLVTRVSLYQGESPTYLNRIITSGTPYHGSPWASSAYQEKKDGIGEIASFMTNTSGGRGLAWDNFDSSIEGASNEFLTRYNSNTSRDYLIKRYYSSIPVTGTGYVGTLLPGCLVLGTKYSPSDCIVPTSSAILNGFTNTINIGSYDHIEINLRVQAVKTQLFSDLP